MKWIFITLGFLIVCGAFFLVQTAYKAGEFKKLEPHFSGSCEPVPGVAGPEDITIDPETGMAFISSDDRRAANTTRPVQGAVYLYDLGNSEPQPTKLLHDLPGEFHPHGISLYTGEGYTRLFVVNHRPDDHTVELFYYRDGRLYHHRSVQSELLVSPNDLLAVGPQRFYVTNDHGSRSSLGKFLEDYLRLPRGNVLYFDGNRLTIAAKRIRYANGINWSRDGGAVYVCSTTGFRIRVYRRNQNTGALDFSYDLKLRTGVDNIEIDSLDRLWVGCHPKLLTFSKHQADPACPSPSQVLRITLRPQRKMIVDEVLLDSGEMLSGSSVAAVYKEQMLIGAVFADRFLHCRF